jgi:hypothetical protein
MGVNGEKDDEKIATHSRIVKGGHTMGRAQVTGITRDRHSERLPVGENIKISSDAY